MITCTEIHDSKLVPADRKSLMVTAGTFAEAQERCRYYGMSGIWFAENKTLYLLIAPSRDDVLYSEPK